MKDNYLLNINNLKDLTIEQVTEKLTITSGIKLKDCNLADLVFFEGKPIYSGNGVYLFKENNEFIYVGNCVARNFIERIPAHFDVRKIGWFNSLLVNIIKKEYNTSEKTDELLVKAAKHAFENYSLILINFEDYSKDSINKLETTLRIILKPYNTFKNKKLDNANIEIDKLSKFI